MHMHMFVYMYMYIHVIPFFYGMYIQPLRLLCRIFNGFFNFLSIEATVDIFCIHYVQNTVSVYVHVC